MLAGRCFVSVIYSLLGRLNNGSLWAQGFADDIAIVINGKFLSTVCELMQKALYIVQTWCRGVGRFVNADKISLVLFTNNRKIVGFKKPILFGMELLLKNQVKGSWKRELISEDNILNNNNQKSFG
jgi:hypothetical protein